MNSVWVCDPITEILCLPCGCFPYDISSYFLMSYTKILDIYPVVCYKSPLRKDIASMTNTQLTYHLHNHYQDCLPILVARNYKIGQMHVCCNRLLNVIALLFDVAFFCQLLMGPEKHFIRLVGRKVLSPERRPTVLPSSHCLSAQGSHMHLVGNIAMCMFNCTMRGWHLAFTLLAYHIFLHSIKKMNTVIKKFGNRTSFR